MHHLKQKLSQINLNRFNPYKKYFTRLGLFFAGCVGFRYLLLYINLHFYKFAIPQTAKLNNPIGEFLIYALLLLFAFAMSKRIAEFKDYDYKDSKWFSSIFLLLSLAIICIPMGFFESNKISSTLYYFGTLYLSYTALYAAVFGKNFLKEFESEHYLLAGIIYIYLWFSLAVLLYWKIFAKFILNTLALMLGLFTKTAKVNLETLNVIVENFNVFIGAPCAGFYSLLLFVIFFISSLYLSRKKDIRYVRAGLVFALGFALLYLLNVLRIAVILLVGAYYSQSLAINFFHEYLGSVLFIFFMYIYLWKAMPLMVKQNGG